MDYYVIQKWSIKKMSQKNTVQYLLKTLLQQLK